MISARSGPFVTAALTLSTCAVLWCALHPPTPNVIRANNTQGAIPDWLSLYKQAYRSMKPGGWIEHAEVSAEIVLHGKPIPSDHVYAQWNLFICQAGEKTGKT